MSEHVAREYPISAGDVYRFLQETTEFGLAITDQHRRLLHVNRGLCLLLGRSGTDIVGKRLEAFQATVAPSAQDGPAVDETNSDQLLPIVTPGGEVRHLDCCWRAIGTGDARTYIVTVFDVTDRIGSTEMRRPGEATKVTDERRQASLRRLARLLSALCHDPRLAPTTNLKRVHRRKKET